MAQREKQQRRVDDITQDRVADRKGGHGKGVKQIGRHAGVEGRAANGMSGQSRAKYGRTRHGRSGGRSTFSAGRVC